jgi:hypothetical protein
LGQERTRGIITRTGKHSVIHIPRQVSQLKYSDDVRTGQSELRPVKAIEMSGKGQ